MTEILLKKTKKNRRSAIHNINFGRGKLSSILSIPNQGFEMQDLASSFVGKIKVRREREFESSIAQSLSLSPAHRPDMIEIQLKEM